VSDSSESFNVTHTENAIAASRMRLLLVHSFLSILGLVRGSVTVMVSNNLSEQALLQLHQRHIREAEFIIRSF